MSEPITAIFAKRLKTARALRGLSQRALGGIVSDDKNTGAVRINRYEQQVNKADMKAAVELARALEVPLAYLFAEDDDQAELLLAFATLTKDERARVVAEVQQIASEKAGNAKG